LEKVVQAWAEDTEFWNDIDDRERQEKEERELAELNALIAKAERKPKPEPVAKTKKPRKKVLKPRTPKS
jgi:lipid II:glycine glycyltransferase (peptidoglycan interpeptide bridge formation enzyme)